MKDYRVNFTWDEEAGVWLAICDEIPLALESNSFDALIEKVKVVASEILALNEPSVSPQIYIQTERLLANG